MKINNNISAVITNKQLLGTESNLAASMERLSSGLKLNHASDNPSGMAISSKMRAQIRGLDQASRNSSDGNSVLQTVDGALSEVTDMIQRMRELAVQAANGTNSVAEQKSCQLEIASLRDEVDRVSQTTEFNTKSLLDGSLDARVYPDSANVNNVSRIAVSDSVPEGTYTFEVTDAATRAEYNLGISENDFVGKNGTISINGSVVEITDTMTATEIYQAIRDGAEYGECDIVKEADGTISVKSITYGAHSSVALLQNFKDGDVLPGVPNAGTDETAVKKVVSVGDDAKVTLGAGLGNNATVSYDGNRIDITNTDGFRMSMLLKDGFTGEISLDVTEIGIMDLQIGANEGQTMQLRIPATDVESLYLDDINVATINGAKKAMERLDDALTTINAIRSQIGAYENRLDYTVNSLDETEENMTAALSRIEDVDMAEEMVEYTKNNVLEQAGTSALAQANSLPELALQILGSR
ncbi:MAG: flagellin [Lachnospiraceae bacterium]|nr:flagellin [Lachnospiraceae bacterium]